MYNAFNYNSPYIAPVPADLRYNQPAKQEIIRVNGENGARAFRMAPNSSALLLDETQPVVWLSQTDGAGYPSLCAYRIEPFKPESNSNELEKRVKRLEEIINESNTFNVKQLKSRESDQSDSVN